MWKAQNRRTFDRKGCAVPVTRPSGMGPGPPLHFFCAARIGPAEQVDLIEVLWFCTFSAQAANGATCASF